MGSIVGYVPYFGLLTDEGRKATWIVKIETSKKPEAQLLGSAIGMKVMEDVPYVVGLDKWLGTELDDAACTYPVSYTHLQREGPGISVRVPVRDERGHLPLEKDPDHAGHGGGAAEIGRAHV